MGAGAAVMADRPNLGVLLATQPQKLPSRTRACGFWVSARIRGDYKLIVDTAQVNGMEALREHISSGDVVLADCLLVVVSPHEMQTMTEAAAELPYPVSGPLLAARLIDEVCAKSAEAAARWGWYIVH